MVVRRTDSEFGGRGGPYPPAEFQLTDDLTPAQRAALERQISTTSVTDDIEAVRSRYEKRADKSDRNVGKVQGVQR
jgi:hypothetical protein